MEHQYSGILLVGGKSRRMGTDKTALPWMHSTMLEWQIEKLRQAGACEILLCGKTDDTMPNVRCIPDILPDRGPLGGICSGLLASACNDSIVISTDIPLLPIDTLKTLCEAHMHDITILRHNDKIEPLIGVYSKRLAPTILSLIQDRSASVRSLLDVCDWNAIEYFGDADLLCNCNTPEEYQRAVRTARESK